jgi:UDP-N-acetylmuramoyl-L-alanyl-D-glutamate--2,6-diaminopimelate ligase
LMHAGQKQTLTYGIEGGDFRAEQVQLAAGETKFVLKTPTGSADVCTQLTGRVNVYNALAAIAAATASGLTLPEAVNGVAQLQCVPGRFQVIKSAAPFYVVVDYAHTPDALRNLIQLARELVHPKARVITLFGCGGNRDRGKRPLMGQAAGELSDLVVVTSDNPRNEDPREIIDEVLAGVRLTGKKFIVEADRCAAMRRALDAAEPSDIVLLAGKGHEKTQVIGDAVLPFDDAVVAAECLKEMDQKFFAFYLKLFTGPKPDNPKPDNPKRDT